MEIANAGLNQINNVQQGTVTRISEMTSEEKRIVIEDLIVFLHLMRRKRG